MSFALELIISLFLLGGALFALVGSIGLSLLPDFFMRLHGPTKATTLGLGCMLTGSIIYFSITNHSLSLHEVLIALFLFITAPVSAHIVGKAAIHIQLKCKDHTKNIPWETDTLNAEETIKPQDGL